MTHKVLVAGVGNIFLGDDGFGVEVAKRLAAMDLPDGVQVADYGISGMHLAYDLADGYQAAILIDTAQRGEKPGTLTVIEAGRPADPLAETRLFDAHGMQPDVVLGVLDMLGASSTRVLVVGCEPASLDYGMELSEPVAGAVDAAVQIVMDLIAKAGAADGSAADGSTADTTESSGEGAPHVPRHTR
jgi:hydrogenase maturation protease